MMDITTVETQHGLMKTDTSTLSVERMTSSKVPDIVSDLMKWKVQ